MAGRTVSFLKTEEVTIMFKSFLAALVGLGFTFAVWAAPVNVNSASAEELSENLISRKLVTGQTNGPELAYTALLAVRSGRGLAGRSF